MADIPPGWVMLAAAIIAALGSGGYFAARGKNKTDLLDQYQEDRDKDRKRISALERRERIRDDYIEQLRFHISEGKPPPPPAFPSGLTHSTEETSA